MLEYCSSWSFWIIIAAVIIAVIWCLCNVQFKKDRPNYLEKGILANLNKKEEASWLSEKSCFQDNTEESFEVRSVRPQVRVHDIQLVDDWIRGEDNYHTNQAACSATREASLSETEELSDEYWEEEGPVIPEKIVNPRRPHSTRKPLGKQSKGEIACKAVAEKIYGCTFHSSIWPDWLRNPETGRAMELDLYCEELQIAIEYHGPQHYKYMPFFHRKGIEAFEAQKRRDNYKLDLCDKNGVYVITVPYTIKFEDIEKYIRYYDPVTYALRQKREQQLGR